MIKEHLSKQENKTFYLTVYPLIQDFKYFYYKLMKIH